MYSERLQSGFTLIELMVAISIVAILLALGLPSFQASLRSNRVTTATNEMLASLSLARTEAIKGIGNAGVCPSSDGSTCGAGTDWSGGWLVWRTDATGAGTVQTPVRYVQQKGSTSVTGPAGGITFNVQGRSIAGARQLGVKPEGASTPARCVQLNATGQARITQGACS